MQSSGSANIITQLGYLQNDAEKGHFGTRRRVGGPGAAPPPAPPGLRGCGALPAGPGRAGGSALPPLLPRGGPGDRTRFSPHSFPFSHFFFLPFFSFFPPFCLAARQPGAQRRRTAPALPTLRSIHRDLPAARPASSFFGAVFYYLGLFSVFFSCRPSAAVPHGPGQAGTRGSGEPHRGRSGEERALRTGARPDRRAGAAPGWSRGAAAGAPPFNLCPPLIAPHLSRAPRAPPFPGAPHLSRAPSSAPLLPARRGRS